MRIKFYSASDWGSGSNIAQAEKMRVENHSFGDTVNDVLEKYNIAKYIAPNISWTPDHVALREWAAPFMGEVQKWFNTRITDDTILPMLCELDNNYIDNFWDLFETQKLYKKISKSQVKAYLFKRDSALDYILQQKQTCIQYDDTIATYIETSMPIRLLISAYDHPQQYTLPPSLTSEKIDCIFSAYIATDDPNINTLRRIEQWKSVKPFMISDKTKYLAKQKHTERCEHHFKEHVGITTGVEVSFSLEQNELSICNQAERIMKICHSGKWILENTEYLILLNNFIYMFGFTDTHQARIQAVSKSHERGIIDHITSVPSNYYYSTNSTFKIKQMLADAQFAAYYGYLKRHDILLEDILTWFFREYLPQEFNVQGFFVELPLETLFWSQKCTLISNLFDSIAKQYKCYIDEGAIDTEFIAFSNTPVPIAQVPSRFTKKYAYGDGDWYHTATFYLFSNQSLLYHTARHESKHRDFYTLISKETVFLSDYEPFQLTEIEWLAKEGIISIDDSGELSLADLELSAVLSDLYFGEVIALYHYPTKYSAVIQKLTDIGALKFSSQLLSDQEADYFSYYLDDKKFTNGLKLRNSYAHGASQLISDENIHHQNYLIFLRLLTLLVIKINDEFCSARNEKICQEDLSTYGAQE